MVLREGDDGEAADGALFAEAVADAEELGAVVFHEEGGAVGGFARNPVLRGVLVGGGEGGDGAGDVGGAGDGAPDLLGGVVIGEGGGAAADGEVAADEELVVALPGEGGDAAAEAGAGSGPLPGLVDADAGAAESSGVVEVAGHVHVCGGGSLGDCIDCDVLADESLWLRRCVVCLCKVP